MPKQGKKSSARVEREARTGKFVKVKGHLRRSETVESVWDVSSGARTRFEPGSSTKTEFSDKGAKFKTAESSKRKRPGKAYNDDTSAGVHESMEGLHELGLISKQTMAEFDELCLTELKELSPKQIRSVRIAENVSQDVFARYLNVGKSTVSKWERGEKKPSGPALKLLTLVKTKGLDAIA